MVYIKLEFVTPIYSFTQWSLKAIMLERFFIDQFLLVTLETEIFVNLKWIIWANIWTILCVQLKVCTYRYFILTANLIVCWGKGSLQTGEILFCVFSWTEEKALQIKANASCSPSAFLYSPVKGKKLCQFCRPGESAIFNYSLCCQGLCSCEGSNVINYHCFAWLTSSTPRKSLLSNDY